MAPKTSPSSPAFSRLVVLVNPKGTNAAKVQACVAALEAAYPGKVVIDETHPTAAGNLQVLRRHLAPGDILLPCGGDGSLSLVITALLDPAMPAPLRRTRVLPIGTGNVNDVAHMLNGKYFADPLYVLQHAHVASIYPLTCTIAPLDRGKAVTKLGVYNIGFGSIGLGMTHYNESTYRAKQQQRAPLTKDIVAAGIAAKTWREASLFDITYQGTRQKMLDIFCSSGHTMAGYWRFPARLSSKEFFVGYVTEKSLAKAARTTIGLFTNTFPTGEVTTGPVEFTLHEAVHAEIDGEHFMTPGPCTVRIEHHREPVTMLATSPKA